MRTNCKVNQMFKLLHEMPKVELHTDLIGTADAETIYPIAQRNRVPLLSSSLEEWKLFYESRDFTHLVEVY